MASLLQLLLIDDSVDDANLILRHLKRAGINAKTHRVWEWEPLQAALSEGQWDLIICDHRLPTFDSSDVLEFLDGSEYADIPLILVSGVINVETAVEAMRKGAADFLSKDDLSRLVPAVHRELERSEIQREKRKAERDLRQTNQKLTLTLQSLASTQEQLIAVEKFRALGQMAGGIAHDFNNALTKMSGVADLIGRQSSEVGEEVDLLQTIIADAAGVVRRLCDFYREAPIREAIPVDVNGILDDVRELTRPRWQNGVGNSSANIEVKVSARARSFALADPGQLREVLTNLIFNASDAIDLSGTIHLISRDIDDGVEIEVRDDGVGMSPDTLSRCIEPLYSTKGERGTGMGLSIVEAVVQAWDGELLITSEVGEGTSVFVRLRKSPFGNRDREANLAPFGRMTRPSPAQAQSLHVLVVDDEPIIATMLERYLENLGHRVHCLNDPLEAVSHISENACDLVISDRAMPEMNGDELAQWVHSVAPQVRFLMVTGFGDLMITNSELPKGVDAILPKPIQDHDLHRALDTLFSPAEGLAS